MLQGRPTKLVAVLLAGALVVGGAFVLTRQLALEAARRNRRPRRPAAVPTRDRGHLDGDRAVTHRQRLAVDAAIARLRAMHPVPARTSRAVPSRSAARLGNRQTCTQRPSSSSC